MNNIPTRLSAVVIAKDEEERIATCLDSLAMCDEIIVIDNGSTDSTKEIAKKHAASVFTVKKADFSTLRNIGKQKAKGIWILYVDADEVVSPALSRELMKCIESPYREGEPVAYFLRRENYYLGKKWPVRDKMQRLFLKSHLVRWTGIVHETADIDGSIETLREPLIHNTHRTLEEMVEKTNIWSDYEAKLRFDTRHPNIVWWRLLRVTWTGFFHAFFREGGWRAGTVGWIESIYQGFSMFLTYAKLWELQEEKKSI